MSAQPLQPARIVWDADGTPRAADFGDLYHPREGAVQQARQVFMAGNGLPARWQGCSDFTIAETGFGLGHNFITTWNAWRSQAGGGGRLHYVAFEAHPPRRADLERAHAAERRSPEVQALLQAWPPLVAGVHRLDFDGGRVRLLLALGDVRRLLPALAFGADAFYLDGFAPGLNAAMWEPRVLRALGRRARAGATAATWSVARSVRDGLAAAGFECRRVPGPAAKREVLQARWAPRHGGAVVQPRIEPRRALVVGAGVAGASVAAALASQGFEVDVFERHAAAAEGSSGNPAGLFHATLHADDGPYARLHRAAALHAARRLGADDLRSVPRGPGPLLRLETQLTLDAMRQRIGAQGLEPDVVQALDPAQAAAAAGVPLAAPAWAWISGGWVAPAALTRALLQHERIRVHTGVEVSALVRPPGGAGWALLDARGGTLARAPLLVLAAAERIDALLQPLGWAPFALQRARGQVSWFDAPPGRLKLPLAGAGYALQTDDGRLLCGATNTPGDDDPALREADHRANFERLQQLCGLRPPADPMRWHGRVGWRVQPADRVPLAGPLPVPQAAALPPGTRLDQARLVPREPGLHVLAGLGARGLTLAPLLGEVVAARITGAPVPLEQDLVDLVDPARFIVRAARRAAGSDGRAGDQRTRT